MISSTEQISDQIIEWRKFCVAALACDLTSTKPLYIEAESIDKFIQFVHKHGLEVILIVLLEQQDKVDLLPEFITSRLIELRRNAHITEIYRKQHLIQLLDLFNQAEIRCLLLKGTALAYSVYQYPYQRPRVDTDVLIHTNDKENLDQFLIKNGFSKADTISGDFVSHQNTYKQNQNDIDHVYDIHWKISNRNAYADRFDFAELYKKRIHLADLNTHAFCLDPVNAFLHSTVHYFGHRSNERDRLIWIYDLHLLVNGF